jgi:spore photoproduct lyase
MPDKKNPQNRPFKEIKDAVKKFKNEAKCPEILNSGELADSLMWEKSERSLSKIVIPMFRGTPHKVLVVTKLDLVDNLLDIDDDLKKNVIASFSINSEQVAKRWEVGAPEPARRVEAAGRLYDAGFEVRVRLDPVVAYPESGWLDSYVALIDRIFARLKPERVTVGSLRGLVSTINNSRDRSWTEYLTERSKWGRRIQFEQRFEIFSAILEHIQNQHNYNNLALCKEPVSMWDALGMDWKHCRCNCTW